MKTKRCEHYFDQKTYNDYLDFFITEEGTDVLPYLYKNSGDFYDEAIKHPDYYVFHDEVELITKNTKILSHYLKGTKNIIEVGPGSRNAISQKTLPLLKFATNLESYLALDISKSFLEQTCELISKNTTLQTNFKSVDFTEPGPLYLENCFGAKNAAIMLGISLGNLTIRKQNLFLQKINSMLCKDDIFITSADTNMDQQSLLKAYQPHKKYYMSFLNNFNAINSYFNKEIDLIEPKLEWCQSTNTVCTYYQANKSLTFYYPFYDNIEIHEGKKLRGIKSKKFSANEFQALIETNGFQTLEIINNSDKIKLFVCKKL